MVAVSFPKTQVMMCCTKEKDITLRKPTTKVTNDVVKFLNNYRYGVFAEAPLKSTYTVSVDEIDDKLAHRLGYQTREEYLANGWNDEFDTRVAIEWDKTQLTVYWDVVEKLGVL